ncbi:MAG: RHS repeat-associated core domain-containing protein [Opitutaceae bacterium]|jgi:RHS repeat-associated protein
MKSIFRPVTFVAIAAVALGLFFVARPKPTPVVHAPASQPPAKKPVAAVPAPSVLLVDAPVPPASPSISRVIETAAFPAPYGGKNGRISLLNLPLDRAPTEHELKLAGQLGSPLTPIGSADPDKLQDPQARQRQQADNALFGQAMDKWNRHQYPAAVAIFKEHRQQFPSSPWMGEVELHMGCESQFTGRWDEAHQHFDAITKIVPVGEDIYQKAKLRQAVLLMEQGMVADSIDTFAEMLKTEKDWERMTYAQNWIRQLSLIKSQLANLRTCGGESIAYVLQERGETSAAAKLKALPAHGDYGYTLAELRDTAAEYALRPTAIESDPRAACNLPVPFIAHYNDEHFVVVTQVEKSTGDLKVYDPRLKQEITLTGAQFASQWSGLGLLLDGRMSPDVRPADASSLNRMGGCCGIPRPEDNLGSTKKKKGPCDGEEEESMILGMPQWEVNPLNMNMVVQDIPLWYDPAYGPRVKIKLSYNSLDSLNQLRPFGPKWMFNYASYAMEGPGGVVTVVMPDGRRDTYTPNGSGGYVSPAKEKGNTLTKTADFTYTVTFSDGGKHQYGVPAGMNGTSSLLLAVEDQNGFALTFGYNSSGALITITDAQSRETQLHYNVAGLVDYITDPFARTCTFSYNANGELTGQTDMGGLAYGYAYTTAEVEYAGQTIANNLFITQISKPQGVTTFYTEPSVAASNGAVKYPTPGAPMWSNYRITVTDPLGAKEEYYYDGYSRFGWHRDKAEYAAGAGDPLATAKKTRYDYYYSGSSADAVISSTTYQDGTSESSSGYDANLNPSTTTDRFGQTRQFTYNSRGLVLTATTPAGAITTYEYAANDLDVVVIKDQANSSAPFKTRAEFAYDTNRRLTSSKNGEGEETRYTYTAQGQVETVKKVAPGTNTVLYTMTYVYYPSTDATAPYRLKEIQREGQVIQSFTYDTIGRVKTTGDADGVTVEYTYDNLNRVTQVLHADATTELTTYNCCQVESTTDRLGRTTHNTYDGNLKLVATVDAAGRRTVMIRDPIGRLVRLEDPAGNVTRWTYDDMGRLTAKTYPDGKGVTYAYTTGSRNYTLTNARSQQQAFTFDNDGNFTGVTATGEPSVSYGYDYRDRRTSMVDVFGTTSYTYDDADRPLSVDGPQANDTITYHYDTAGRLDSRTIAGASSTVIYDSLGRVSNEINPLGSFDYIFPGVSPRLSRVDYPNGQKAYFAYKSVGEEMRLDQLRYETSPSTVISQFDYGYDAAGTITTWRQQQGAFGATDFAFSYDTTNQLTGATERDAATQAVLSRKAWRYDAAGNRVLVQGDNDRVRSTNYNNLNQAVSDGGGGKILFQGHTDESAMVTVQGQPARLLSGNRFEAEVTVAEGANTVAVQAADANGNQRTQNYQVSVAAAPTVTYTYDDDGNLLSDGTRTYTWDTFSRLKTVTTGGSTSTFNYDGVGRRVHELVNGVLVKQWLWADGPQPVEERDASGVTTKRYYGQGFQTVTGGVATSYYYTKDHLGSVREVVDGSGAVRGRYTFDLWGDRSANLVTSNPVNSDVTYTGHLLHAGSGLSMTFYRAYNPKEGLWLSRDPIAEEGGVNLYGYVGNDPVNDIDPLGLSGGRTPGSTAGTGHYPAYPIPGYPNNTNYNAAHPVTGHDLQTAGADIGAVGVMCMAHPATAPAAPVLGYAGAALYLAGRGMEAAGY